MTAWEYSNIIYPNADLMSRTGIIPDSIKGVDIDFDIYGNESTIWMSNKNLKSDLLQNLKLFGFRDVGHGMEFAGDCGTRILNGDASVEVRYDVRNPSVENMLKIFSISSRLNLSCYSNLTGMKIDSYIKILGEISSGAFDDYLFKHLENKISRLIGCT